MHKPAQTTPTNKAPRPAPQDKPREPVAPRVRSGIKSGGNDDPHSAF